MAAITWGVRRLRGELASAVEQVESRFRELDAHQATIDERQAELAGMVESLQEVAANLPGVVESSDRVHADLAQQIAALTDRVNAAPSANVALAMTTGRASLPLVAAGSTVSVSTTFDQPMPNASYEAVAWTTSGGSPSSNLRCEGLTEKTKTGCKATFKNTGSVPLATGGSVQVIAASVTVE